LALFAARGANAIAAKGASVPVAGNLAEAVLIYEWVLGVTTAINVDLRVGVATPYSPASMNINAQGLFGVVNDAWSLLVEEIAL
jgi:hypothetical protein